ncbi:MAG: hypothetical protein DLM60_17200, partial [Pseudonocardiales bacterium]
MQTADEVDLNPVLLHALQREYGLDLDIDELADSASGSIRLDEFGEYLGGRLPIMSLVSSSE